MTQHSRHLSEFLIKVFVYYFHRMTVITLSFVNHNTLTHFTSQFPLLFYVIEKKTRENYRNFTNSMHKDILYVI